jgi:CHAT domain
VRLATGDLAGSVAAAEQAVAAFAALERRAWVALARAVLLRAQAASGPGNVVVDELEQNAGELAALGCRHDALRTTLLQAEVRIGRGDLAGADALLRRAAPAVRLAVTEQPGALRVRALLDEAKGDRRRARRAVNLGVRLLTEQQATLGAVELRAHAAANSDGLATIGVRLAIADRRPRELLAHLEATRRTTSLLVVGRPPDDDVLADLLAALRRVTAELREVELDVRRRAVLEADQLDLERRVRNHVRRTPAAGARADVGLAACIGRLGERALLEYANLHGRLLVVAVVDNRTTLHDLGPVDGLVADIDGCTHALHRLNRRQGSAASRASATATLGAITAELAERLVPRRVLRSVRPVVVVPTGVLHALPWGALPGLTGRAISVAPSLTGWAIAAGRQEPAEHVILVAGPALEHAEQEVDALRAVHEGSTVLTGSAATADAVLAAIGKSDLAHIACHGSYRFDNPLFSTLRLHDGPLTAYDLERCAAIPRTVILSACNVAMGAPAGGGALLGLASSLMTFGAGSVIAPLTPVSDEGVVPVMTRLHRGLLEGLDPARALAQACLTDGGLLDPTAASFVAIGA